jgi:hypothetical protein
MVEPLICGDNLRILKEGFNMDIDRRGITRVDFTIGDNVWWDDQLQLGDPSDFSWTLNGANFFLSIKKDEDDANPPVLALTSAAGQIQVVDPIARILGMNVPDATISGALSEGDYIYDCLMQTISTGQVDGLFYGKIHVEHGITTPPS